MSDSLVFDTTEGKEKPGVFIPRRTILGWYEVLQLMVVGGKLFTVISIQLFWR